MKILTIIGARPQFVKAAVFSAAIRKRNNISEILVHTGQHYDNNMSDIFFNQMNIPKPDYHLGIGNCGHGAMTGRQLEKIEELLLKEKPDFVNVYGDTNSTLAGALAAAKLNIPVIHIEAGLRSFNKRMPEEINRILTDHVSSFLFVPTAVAEQNLRKEGIDQDKIFVVGDIMYDAVVYYSPFAVKPDWFEGRQLKENEFNLCTIHRQETLSKKENLAAIFSAFEESPKTFVLPLHPHTQKIIQQQNISIPANVCVMGPVGYLEMLWLLRSCNMVLTDSGGLQKEAFFNQKRCITLREQTEWVETVQLGWNVLAGNDKKMILDALQNERKPNLVTLSPYGDGHAADKMLDIVVKQ